MLDSSNPRELMKLLKRKVIPLSVRGEAQNNIQKFVKLITEDDTFEQFTMKNERCYYSSNVHEALDVVKDCNDEYCER